MSPPLQLLVLANAVLCASIAVAVSALAEPGQSRADFEQC